jgi:hypothetical protein
MKSRKEESGLSRGSINTTVWNSVRWIARRWVRNYNYNTVRHSAHRREACYGNGTMGASYIRDHRYIMFVCLACRLDCRLIPRGILAENFEKLHACFDERVVLRARRRGMSEDYASITLSIWYERQAKYQSLGQMSQISLASFEAKNAACGDRTIGPGI